jgi:hypothetical protein
MATTRKGTTKRKRTTQRKVNKDPSFKLTKKQKEKLPKALQRAILKSKGVL